MMDRDPDARRIDKSVIALLIGLGVGAFMWLVMLGMENVRQNAERASEPDRLQAEPTDEVVDFAE